VSSLVEEEAELETFAHLEFDESPISIRKAVLGSTEGRIGVVLGLIVLAVIVFGRFVTPYSPTHFLSGPVAASPSSAHLLGTDADGRDVLSRLLTGGDTVILIPLVAVCLACLLGGSLGLVSAYARGRIDTVITKLFDIMLTLPPLLVVLVVIAGFGTASFTLIVTVALVFSAGFGRVVRSATQSVVVNAYVAAAQARGERVGAILLREILPNIVAPVLAEFGLRLTYGILFVSGLSFLGLGVQPPRPDWGLMVAENRGLISVAPLATVAPVVAIAMLSISLNLMTDALISHLTREEAGQVIAL
jgi:peptide/nickel transport system permease protein